jgi:hypothetical protein
MKHLKSYNLFESITLPTTSKDDLTNYYTCYKCKSIFNTFNKEANICPYCGQNDPVSISDFEYMAIAKNTLSPEEYKKEMNSKKKRESEYVDLIEVGINDEIKKMKSRYN